MEEKLNETASNWTLNYNPVHPNRKRRSMRQLNSNERLLLVKLASFKTRTSVEIADLMNVKVQVIYDLMKDLRRKQNYFVKKKAVETSRQLHETAITKTVSNSLAMKQNIWTLKQIQTKASAYAQSTVPLKTVSKVLKTQFRLSYRKIKRVS